MSYESGKAFLEAVKSGTLRSSILIVGPVKKSDDNPNAVLFAPDGGCDHWVSIPADMIAKVEMIGNTQCGDHRHAVVSVTLNDPDPKNVQATVLSALLRSLTESFAGPIRQAGGATLRRFVKPIKVTSPCTRAKLNYANAYNDWVQNGKPISGPIWEALGDADIDVFIFCELSETSR